MNLLDKHTGFIEKIKNKTANSYLITRTKSNEKGIACDNWFTLKDLHSNFFTLKTYAEYVILELKKCDPKNFASLYIKYRLESYFIFHNGLILSASHGINYFDNIVIYYDNPDSWLEWGDKKRKDVVYETNFIKLLNNNKI